MNKLFVVLFVLVVSVMSLNAQTVWTADPAHSAVNFSVTHMLLTEVTGRFGEFEASLTQGKDDFTGSSVEATIKTASINTDNEYRDKHLRSGDFFLADSFPTITFKSTAFEKTGEGKYKITGNLTMHGVTKPVVLDAKMNGPVKDMRGNSKVGFKAITTIDRFDYGVKWDKKLDTGGFVVSKDVDVTLTLELGQKAPGGDKK